LTISFWFRDHGIDNDDDVYLQLYNGSAYGNKYELGNSTEDTWNFYSTTIYNTGSDAQYFRSNFRLKFEGSWIDYGEELWIDDVSIVARNDSASGTVDWQGLQFFVKGWLLCSEPTESSCLNCNDPANAEYCK
jgi:hypothetical protein